MGKIVDSMFDKTMPGLNKALDLTWKRHEALVSNISNSETPQYRAVDVDFGSELEKAFNTANGSQSLKVTNARHLDLKESSSSHTIPDLSGATRADGNNVDLDIQMGKLAYNQGKYSMASSLIRKKLQVLRTTIRYAMR